MEGQYNSSMFFFFKSDVSWFCNIIGENSHLNSLLMTRQMTLFHQRVWMGEKLVPCLFWVDQPVYRPGLTDLLTDIVNCLSGTTSLSSRMDRFMN